MHTLRIICILRWGWFAWYVCMGIWGYMYTWAWGLQGTDIPDCVLWHGGHMASADILDCTWAWVLQVQRWVQTYWTAHEHEYCWSRGECRHIGLHILQVQGWVLTYWTTHEHMRTAGPVRVWTCWTAHEHEGCRPKDCRHISLQHMVLSRVHNIEVLLVLCYVTFTIIFTDISIPLLKVSFIHQVINTN